MKKFLLFLFFCFFVMVYGLWSIDAFSQEDVLKSCDQIDVENCPLDRCAKMINCRGEEICTFKMFDPPKCGNLSYAGQDVFCCEGLVRRCGVAFLDDTCDMYGDDSEYSLPICIPCGDDICGNFENVCNCPEDCWPDGDREYTGQKFDEEVEAEKTLNESEKTLNEEE